nr:MAG TPA: hypothetical protein [Bacteriophage sp.]
MGYECCADGAEWKHEQGWACIHGCAYTKW